MDPTATTTEQIVSRFVTGLAASNMSSTDRAEFLRQAISIAELDPDTPPGSIEDLGRAVGAKISDLAQRGASGDFSALEQALRIGRGIEQLTERLNSQSHGCILLGLKNDGINFPGVPFVYADGRIGVFARESSSHAGGIFDENGDPLIVRGREVSVKGAPITTKNGTSFVIDQGPNGNRRLVDIDAGEVVTANGSAISDCLNPVKSPNGETYIAVESSGIWKLLNIDTGQVLKTHENSFQACKDPVFGAGGSGFWPVTTEDGLKIVDVSDGSLVGVSGECIQACDHICVGAEGTVYAVIKTDKDDQAKFLSLPDGNVTRPPAGTQRIEGLTISPEGQAVALIAKEDSSEFFDLNNQERIKLKFRKIHGVEHALISAAGELYAVVTAGNRRRIFDSTNRKLLKIPFDTCRFCRGPGGKILAAVKNYDGRNGVFDRLIDLETQKPLIIDGKQTQGCYLPSIGLDDRVDIPVVADIPVIADGTVHILEVPSGKLTDTRLESINRIGESILTQNGEKLLPIEVTDTDNQLFNLSRGSFLCMEGHQPEDTKPPTQGPNGRTVVPVQLDRKWHVYDVDRDHLQTVQDLDIDNVAGQVSINANNKAALMVEVGAKWYFLGLQLENA